MGLRIKALSLLIFVQGIMAFSQSVADEFLTILSKVPTDNKSGVASIIGNYEKTCAEYQDGKNNQSLVIDVENVISTILIQGDTDLTVVIADFKCPGHGNPWTGSSGSPTYLIIGDRIFRAPNSRPTFHNVGKHTLILFWHHGSYCKTVNSTNYLGADPCFSAIYWNAYYKTFVTYDGSLNVTEIQ